MPRPGRKPRGERSAITVRLPVDHRSVYQNEADAQGLGLGDYIMLKLAESHDLEEPAYMQRDDPGQLRLGA